MSITHALTLGLLSAEGSLETMDSAVEAVFFQPSDFLEKKSGLTTGRVVDVSPKAHRCSGGRAATWSGYATASGRRLAANWYWRVRALTQDNLAEGFEMPG